MAKITVVEQEEILTFPADSILELKIDSVEIKTVPGRNGDWQKVECKFKILGIQAIGDGSPVEAYENWITRDIWGSVPFRLTDSPENKLRQWSEAIFRQELGLGFELDTDLFENRKVRGVTSTYQTRPDSQGKQQTRHQISDLLPFGETSGAGTTAAAPAAAPAAAKADDPWATSSWGDSDEPPFN